MVRLTPIHAGDHMSSMPLAIGVFISASALVVLCAKRARKVSRKDSTGTNDSKMAPRSPLKSPKQLMTTISNKVILFIHHRRTEDKAEAEIGDKAEEGFGEGGLWQKEILMGEKCQPPEFSGVIYYDSCGNRISELPPRSPRASPLRSFPVPENEN